MHEDFRPGELVEIALPDRLAHVQMTHLHASYPPVVRVLENRPGARSGDPATIAAGATAFTAMLPLGAVLMRLGLQATRLGVQTIPASDAGFPTFRMPIRGRSGEVLYWWLWDGTSLRYEVAPGTDLDALPMREVMSAEDFLAGLTR